ncbi:hypothetical protein ASD11_17520 [Aeromicrobium sp. Root495]|uniref:hypothetical protein n=1 Tax=Aeromicrobium sp. Root495 TaxID=1736550 RepID=UPI0006F30361|nr:hypothetical protein [Aeromicrobium sp. Root495]KQY55342.1 hypothetical protein ASD11_17520 [Aeromicrobium sp. Root495]RYJ05852.1 MAG: hypothetical protein EON52_09400 [Actinomycetales bacterium]
MTTDDDLRLSLRSDLAGLADAIRTSDTLLAVGSVVSGLASSSTHLDLLLIGPGAPAKSVAASVAGLRSGSYVLASGQSVTVRFCSTQELAPVRDVVMHFAEAMVEPSAWANIPSLDHPTHVLLHEVRNGITIAHESIAQAWREALYVDQLPTYLASTHLLRHLDRRENVEQQLVDQHLESAQWMLRESLQDLLAALLASIGETNPHRRWHLRLARRHQEVLGHDLVDRLVKALCVWHDVDEEAEVRAALELADEVRRDIVERIPGLRVLSLAVER